MNELWSTCKHKGTTHKNVDNSIGEYKYIYTHISTQIEDTDCDERMQANWRTLGMNLTEIGGEPAGRSPVNRKDGRRNSGRRIREMNYQYQAEVSFDWRRGNENGRKRVLNFLLTAKG